MPTYKNISNNIIIKDGHKIPAKSVRKTLQYINHDSLSLIDHEPRINPFVTLHFGVIPNEAISNLENYRQLIIYNDTGNYVIMSSNEDASNQMILSDQSTFIFDDCAGEFFNLIFSGEGNGNLYIYGIPAKKSRLIIAKT